MRHWRARRSAIDRLAGQGHQFGTVTKNNQRMVRKMKHIQIVSTAVIAFLAGSLFANAAQDSSSGTLAQLKFFGDVFERVRADYVEPVNDKQLVEAAVRGMLSSLDPHSSYLDSKEYEDMQVQTRGEFGGLGIEVTMENGLVKVVSPIDDTPASRAGLQSGDLITSIDRETVQGMTLSDAVGKLRGKVRTSVTLTIRRGTQQPFDVKLTREVIRVQPVQSRMEGNVGYIRITSFTEQTTSGLETAIAKIKADGGKNLKGLILDLRNNPGGLLDQSISVSSDFLNQGIVVSTRGRRSEDATLFKTQGKDLLNGLPMVVLVNAGSASASEIVAGALQDHKRATIVGTRSFGKGSVQSVIPIPGRGALRLTTARYYTPSGRSIQGTGIDPDVVVEQAAQAGDRPKELHEADLKGSLKNPQTEKPAKVIEDGQIPKSAAAPAESAKPASQPGAAGAQGTPPDNQLNKALELLRGSSL
ncbi:MAG: S41 family peptidase [Alphaproteobacteria bacterium]